MKTTLHRIRNLFHRRQPANAATRHAEALLTAWRQDGQAPSIPGAVTLMSQAKPVTVQVKLLRKEGRVPRRMTKGAAGFDVVAPSDGLCEPGAVARVPLGFALAIPAGHVGLLVGRSSYGLHYGAGVPQGFGAIDSDYRGEVSMLFRTERLFAWKMGDRIAQLLVVPVADFPMEEVAELDDTERGIGGF